MKLYYCEKLDIMCIIEENGKIQKFVGEFCKHDLIKLCVVVLNGWYKASVHPQEYSDFELIGEL